MGAFFKFIVVAGLMAAGAYFIAKGLGAPLPFVNSKWVQTASVPAGAILLAAAIGVAYFWKVTKTKKTEVTVTEETPDGKKTTTTRLEETTTLAEPPY